LKQLGKARLDGLEQQLVNFSKVSGVSGPDASSWVLLASS